MDAQPQTPQPHEFDFLTHDARWVGRTEPLPNVRRVSETLPDGRTVSALQYGDESPRCVFLHGAGLNAHSFDPTVLALDVPAIAVDLPGHGHSDWRSDADYSPHALASDLLEVLPRWAPRPEHLIGHSLGGLAAIAIASASPENFKSLTLVDITPSVVSESSPKVVREFIQGQRSFSSLDDMVDRAIDFGIGADRSALMRGVSLNARQRPDGQFEWIHHLAHLDRLPATDEDPEILWEELADLQVTRTLIRAEHGMVTEKLAEEWAQRLPREQLLTIPGPHNLHEANPIQLAEALRALFSPSA